MNYTGEPCPDCGHFTLRKAAAGSLACDACGKTSEAASV